jgi:hypothetical protein
MEKQELLNNVKHWINLDVEINKMNTELKRLKKQKKNITDTLMITMKTNDIDCFDVTGCKLIYTKRKSKKALSKKHLISALSKFYKDNEDHVTPLSRFILESREDKTNETIRRKIIKK